MIDVEQFKKYENVERNLLLLGFVQLEEKYNSLLQEFQRLKVERNALLAKVTGVVLPTDVPKISNPQPINTGRPREPTVTPPPLDLSKIPIN